MRLIDMVAGDPPTKKRPAPSLSADERGLLDMLARAGSPIKYVNVRNLGKPGMEGQYDAFSNVITLNADSSRFTSKAPYIKDLPIEERDAGRYVLAHEIAHLFDRPQFLRGRQGLMDAVDQQLRRVGASDELRMLGAAISGNHERFADAAALSLLDFAKGQNALQRSLTRDSVGSARADTLSAALLPILITAIKRGGRIQKPFVE